LAPIYTLAAVTRLGLGTASSLARAENEAPSRQCDDTEIEYHHRCRAEITRPSPHCLGITPKWVDGTIVGGCSFMIHARRAAAAIASGGIVNSSGRGMLAVSVARQLGLGNSFARLLCCPAQAERARKKAPLVR
jgi:hypothetical protein